MREVNFDFQKLKKDILSAAGKYEDLSCVVSVLCDGHIERLNFGDCPAGEDAKYVLDCAGGMIAGLTALRLCEDGVLSPRQPVCRYITSRELPLAPDLTIEHLLRRTSSLPDPLHLVLLTALHRDPDFIALSTEQQLRREASAILANRGYTEQLRLLRDCQYTDGIDGFAPSSLDETLLCELVIRSSGNTLWEYQMENIFRPIGVEPLNGMCTDSPGHICGADQQPVSFTADRDSAGLCTVTLLDLELMLVALAGRKWLSSGWELIDQIIGTHSLPFYKKDGFMCGISEAAGWSIHFMFEHSCGCGVLIASDRPLPTLPEGNIYRRLDGDILKAINSQRIFPAHTRMERLSLRNLSGSLSVETEPEQRDFTASPAADIARSAVEKQRETFAATERGVTVGLLSFSMDITQEHARIETLLVDRRYRRRGFGMIMVSWVLRHLRQKGVRRVSLCVDRRNLPARKLYSNVGFELCAVYESVYVYAITL